MAGEDRRARTHSAESEGPAREAALAVASATTCLTRLFCHIAARCAIPFFFLRYQACYSCAASVIQPREQQATSGPTRGCECRSAITGPGVSLNGNTSRFTPPNVFGIRVDALQMGVSSLHTMSLCFIMISPSQPYTSRIL